MMYNIIISYIAHASRPCVIMRLAKQSFSLKSMNIKLFVMALLLIMSQVACQNTGKHTRVLDEVKTMAEEAVIISDDFQSGVLSEKHWKLTRQGDFKISTIDVYAVDKGDLRLRMLADTIGTRDDTVKFHGVRSIKPIDFAGRSIIAYEIDWNNQTNGCYLTTGMYLCPTVTDTNPRDEPNWISFDYVGVPPGKNARFQIMEKVNGNLRFLYTEGWPDKQKAGRKIGNQQVKVFIDNKHLKIIENGKELFNSEDSGLRFTQAYLYLQMSSHNNYPAREIYFDNIAVLEIK